MPNLLSGSRLLLSFLFLVQEPWVRVFLVCIAALTDCLDGYFARIWGQQSRLGVVLDPLADKIFVFMGVGCFWMEDRLSGWAAALFFTREWVLLWFVGYLLLKGLWKQFSCRSVWSGKSITTLQFLFFLALSMDYPIPIGLLLIFVPLAFMMGGELWCVAQEISLRTESERNKIRVVSYEQSGLGCKECDIR